MLCEDTYNYLLHLSKNGINYLFHLMENQTDYSKNISWKEQMQYFTLKDSFLPLMYRYSPSPITSLPRNVLQLRLKRL